MNSNGVMSAGVMTPSGLDRTGLGSAPPLQASRSVERLREFEEVRQAVVADDHGKWDACAWREDIALKDGLLTFTPEENGAETRLAPTTWASGQLCARLGIPVAYFRKCPTVLQDVQANFWLKEAGRATSKNEGERWLLRAREGMLRAVLSERYSPLDNGTLLETLAPLISARYRVDWCGLSDESLHLRIIDPNRAREVLPDDELSVGIHISNSEVGLRSVTVDALVYRLVCKNGLIRLVRGKSLLRQRHIHLAQPRFVAALEEAVESALREADGFIEQLGRTTKEPVRDVEGTLKRLGIRWNLSQNTREAVEAALRREVSGQQETVYGLVNAFTSVAQGLPDEGRYDMEVLAGHLAQHGVAAYAPAPSHPKPRHSESREPLEEAPFDVVEAAREMFEAEVVSRRSHPVPFPKEAVGS